MLRIFLAMNEPPDYCPKPDAEPTATSTSVPIWIFILMLVLLFLGAVYFDRHSGWFDSKLYAPYNSVDQLAVYQPRSGEAALAARGKTVYENVCGICHGNDGLGKANQAPPLAGSEWVARDAASLARVPLVGLNGPIQVSGHDWNLAMAPMGAGLSDADLAAVLTYLRTAWGNKSSPVSEADMKAIRAAISGNAPSAAELAKMTPVERGHEVFKKYGCFQCHGPDGKGGVTNPNAKTAEQVPSLIYVADGYNKAELTAFISRGERVIPRKDPAGPEPPHFMPKWGPIISTNELSDISEFLFSLKPKGEKLDF
jgi:mono/diheme cytochrome c family protein